MPVALMVGVDNRVTSATLDQPVVDGKSGGERDREGESQTGPEKKRVETGIHRAGNREHHPLSTSSIIAIKTVSAASANFAAWPKATPAASSGRGVSG